MYTIGAIIQPTLTWIFICQLIGANQLELLPINVKHHS